MRRRALGPALVVWIVASAAPLAAQDAFAGVAGGASLSDLAGGGFDTDRRWGATLGFMLGARAWKYALGMVELNWVQKGGRGGRLNYLELPVLVGGSTPSDFGFTARVYTGLTVALPIGCSATSLLVDCDNTRSPDLSWPIGAQLGTARGPGQFFGVEARYFVGLTDVLSTVPELRNRGWQLRLVTTFPLGDER